MFWVIAVWIMSTSVVTAAMFVLDKYAAKHERRRISERTLLVWSAIGGWPGGLLASRLIRHKTKKRSFRISFVFCCIFNVASVLSILWHELA